MSVYHPSEDKRPKSVDEDRRSFLSAAAASVVGGAAGVVPIASGVAVFLDPLRRQASANVVRVAALDSVPDDGLPRQFAVIADRVDAWNFYPDEPIGAVYLLREKGETSVRAFNAFCPHAGCFVDYNETNKRFQCPCHDSKFAADGTRIEPERCPSPRDLDSLVVDAEKLLVGEVWVEFKNFRSGTSDKIEE